MQEINQLKAIAKVLKIGSSGRIKNFSAHIPIYIEKKNFIVKTAD